MKSRLISTAIDSAPFVLLSSLAVIGVGVAATNIPVAAFSVIAMVFASIALFAIKISWWANGQRACCNLPDFDDEADQAIDQIFTTGYPPEGLTEAWLRVHGETSEGYANHVVLGVREAGDWKIKSTLESIHEKGGVINAWKACLTPDKT